MAQETHVSAAERCYRTLSRMIVALDLKPNSPIGEQMLAELLGVSRTPVREAMSRLSVERLVDLRARSGAVVSPIRLDAVGTAQFVREKLEMGVMAEAASGRNRRIQLSIRQAIEEQELAISEKNFDLFFEADDRMHCLYCALAGRESVWAFIADAKKHMDRVRRLSIQTGHMDALLQDHLDLAAAVTEGDVERSQSITRTHLRRVLADMEDLATRFPDYFELHSRDWVDS